MGKMLNQTKAELKQLPLMLAKLAGGLAAVTGFTAAAIISTRKPGSILQDILPSILLGCAGVVIFVLSARLFNRRSSSRAAETPPPVHGIPVNVLSWTLLLLFAGIFLACSYFLTR